MVGRLVGLQQAAGLAEAVQIAQVALRVQQLLPVVLAVDVQQLAPQLPKLSHRHRPAVDPAQVLSIAADLPLEQQLLLLRAQAVVLQPGQLGQAGENSGDMGRLGSGADQLPAGPLPQNSADGVDDNGFARASLAGEDVEAPAELDVHRLNDGDILDVKQ